MQSSKVEERKHCSLYQLKCEVLFMNWLNM